MSTVLTLEIAGSVEAESQDGSPTLHRGSSQGWAAPMKTVATDHEESLPATAGGDEQDTPWDASAPGPPRLPAPPRKSGNLQESSASS